MTQGQPRRRSVRRRRAGAAGVVSVMIAIAAIATVAGRGGSAGRPAGQAPPARSLTTPTPTATVAAAPARSTASRRTMWRVYGSGSAAVAVVQPAAATGPVGLVLFLHGWGYQGARDYRAWIRHLARRGNAVIVPRYQVDTSADPARARGEMVRAVRTALRQIDAAPRSLVVAGHSAGAALAADYAAVAGSHGLPRPLAVFAVYPGRAIQGTGGLPAADMSRISPDTRLRVLAGAGDTVVGQAPARQLLQAATSVPAWRRRFVLVRRPGASDHLAPLRSSGAARQTFWRRLDRLIDDVRGGD